MTELNISNNRMTWNSNSYTGQMSGVVAIANAIPTMRAMTSLDISSNYLYEEGAKYIAAALPECK